MRASFGYLEISNFKSFAGDGHTFDFGDHPLGLCFLKGRNEKEPRLSPNGSGKSSIWDALCWVLYGRTADGLRNTDVVSWQVKGTTKVSLCVLIDDHDFVIERSANPNRLTINNNDTSQEHITDLIGLSFEVFTHTVLHGQGVPLFFDLTPSEKLQIFSDVLALDKWDARSADAAEKSRDIEQKQRTCEVAFEKLCTEIDVIDQRISDEQSASAAWQDTRMSEHDELEKELKRAKKSKATGSSKVDEFVIEEDRLGVTINEISESIDVLDADLSEKEVELRKVGLEIEAAADGVSAYKYQLKELGETDTCPTCGQSVAGTDLDAHRKKAKTSLSKLKDRVNALEAKASVLREVVASIDARLDEQVKRRKATTKKLQKVADDKSYWFMHLQSSEAQAKALSDRIRSFEDQVNPHAKAISVAKKCKRELVAQKKELQSKLTKMERRLQRTRFWVKGFKDVRLHVIDQVLGELELATNALLMDVGLEDWQVRYVVEKETKAGTTKRSLDVFILSPTHKEPVRWKCWSGGESQRLRIVGSLALSEVLLRHAGVSVDLEVLDEPTTYLSEKGVNELCDFLAERADRLQRQIWYVDHHTQDSTKFASSATIVKAEKGSYVA